MQENYFEQIHNASADLPYFDGEMRNINYLSHFHTEIELILVRSGSVDIACEGKSFRADAGSICIFMPGEIHSFSSPCDNHLYIIKLYCRNSTEKTDFSSLRIPQCRIEAGTPENTALAQKIEVLALEMTEKKPGYAFAANAAASDILAYILRALPLIGIDPTERRRHMSQVALLELVGGFIREHFAEDVELDAAAKYCSLSKYYFAHLFKNAFGTTFYEYLTLYRLERSVPLLLDTDKKISEIALDCGFSNIRSFNRAFRRVYKKSPTEYRISRGLGENP